MTSEFWKILRSKESKQVNEEKEKQAIKQMTKWNVTDGPS